MTELYSTGFLFKVINIRKYEGKYPMVKQRRLTKEISNKVWKKLMH
jgi:hypothetical protein